MMTEYMEMALDGTDATSFGSNTQVEGLHQFHIPENCLHVLGWL